MSKDLWEQDKGAINCLGVLKEGFRRGNYLKKPQRFNKSWVKWRTLGNARIYVNSRRHLRGNTGEGTVSSLVKERLEGYTR